MPAKDKLEDIAPFQHLPMPEIIEDEAHQSEKSSLDVALLRFAVHIVNEMQKPEVPFANKIDAFRAVTAYHSASAKTKKLTGADGDETDDQPPRADFPSLKRRMKVVGEDENGTVKASNR